VTIGNSSSSTGLCALALWLCRFATEIAQGVKRRWHDGSLENDLPFRQLSEMFNVNHFIVGQTNPHLVPLMSLRKVVPAPAFNLMQAEVKHFFMQAQTYLPAWIPTKWMSLFTQAWEGDVTILLPWKLYAKNISKAMYNPTAHDLIEADNLGTRAAWERMSAIQVRGVSWQL
jgi:TAG lipase / steryl ester hydrolase / phospholipase A2 / LPA acyltransferase